MVSEPTPRLSRQVSIDDKKKAMLETESDKYYKQNNAEVIDFDKGLLSKDRPEQVSDLKMYHSGLDSTVNGVRFAVGTIPIRSSHKSRRSNNLSHMLVRPPTQQIINNLQD
jgi:hypothetical protein